MWGAPRARSASSTVAKRRATKRRCSRVASPSRIVPAAAAPAVDARRGVVEVGGVDDRPGPVDQVGHDLQVGGLAVGVGELGGQRPHQGTGQRPQVGLAGGLVGVEHGVAPVLDRALVLGQDGPEQPVAVTEVVLQRRGVLGAGHPVDLAEADGVDAAVGEEALGRPDQAVAGRPAGHGRHGPSSCGCDAESCMRIEP